MPFKNIILQKKKKNANQNVIQIVYNDAKAFRLISQVIIKQHKLS